MAETPSNMCQKVVENYLKRIIACNTTRGGYLNDLVFHTECQRSNFAIKRKYHEKNILYVFHLRLLLKPRNG